VGKEVTVTTRMLMAMLTRMMIAPTETRMVV
jgi:hypothetical protein